MGAEQSRDNSGFGPKKTETANFDFRFEKLSKQEAAAVRSTVHSLGYQSSPPQKPRPPHQTRHQPHFEPDPGYSKPQESRQRPDHGTNCYWLEVGMDVVKRLESEDKFTNFYSR